MNGFGHSYGCQVAIALVCKIIFSGLALKSGGYGGGTAMGGLHHVAAEKS